MTHVGSIFPTCGVSTEDSVVVVAVVVVWSLALMVQWAFRLTTTITTMAQLVWYNGKIGTMGRLVLLILTLTSDFVVFRNLLSRNGGVTK